MKTFIRRLARVRHALYAAILQGALVILAGHYLGSTGKNHQDNPLLSAPALIGAGAAVVLAATVLVFATYLVAPALEGEIVALQQPQLPDVQAHMRPHTDLSQAA